jgi:DNA-binding IclR family transcriptional regulator
MAGDGGGVAAVERALSILNAFNDRDQKVTLAELSSRTGLYKSTVLRLAKSLERFGYLRRSDEGTYWLGAHVLHLGSLYQRHFRTAEFVPPVLRKLAEELKEGASFYVRDGDERVCLHRIDSTRAVRDSVHEGDRLPLAVGASGRVISAFTGAVGARHEQIRQDMYAASYGERDPETAAVACPVFRVQQQFAGALSISGPKYRIEALGVERVLPVLFRYAGELTRILGGNPDVLANTRGKRRAPKRAAQRRGRA